MKLRGAYKETLYFVVGCFRAGAGWTYSARGRETLNRYLNSSVVDTE